MAFQEGSSKESIKLRSNDSHSKSNDDLANQIWEKSTPQIQCKDDIWEKFITQFSIKVTSSASSFTVIPVYKKM